MYQKLFAKKRANNIPYTKNKNLALVENRLTVYIIKDSKGSEK
jgi:hypothetical protein